MVRNKKSFLTFMLISGIILLLTRCINTEEETSDPRGKAFAGSASCKACHAAICNAYTLSAHAHTTEPASKNNIQGSFQPDSDFFMYDAQTKMVMENRDSGFYQVAYANGKQQEAHQFDITFGLKHAQTFLYWNGNRTFELPVSYYSAANGWAASPGFTQAQPSFNRFVGKDCFECHSSYIESRLIPSAHGIQEVYEKNTLIYGIDCERCHGPATNHVNYQLAHPDSREAKYIVKIRSLSRQQKLDVCAVCHSGNDKTKETSTFRFRPGDTLANFFSPWASHNSKKTGFDVHGNQYQLLAQSQCFLQSQTLDCSTCHNPHTNAGSELRAYAQKCMNCHMDVQHTALTKETAAYPITDCIDCHMPEQASKAITFQLAGSALKPAYMLRTHRIAVYSDTAKKTTGTTTFLIKKRT